MPRQRKSVAIHREKISVSIPEDLLEWLESRAKDHTFANISNGVVLCILEGQKKYGK
jgi:metal-responsive CopG/Arc/MetJ family transcriptional regulator